MESAFFDFIDNPNITHDVIYQHENSKCFYFVKISLVIFI